jgi:hypothetical protein
MFQNFPLAISEKVISICLCLFLCLLGCNCDCLVLIKVAILFTMFNCQYVHYDRFCYYFMVIFKVDKQDNKLIHFILLTPC